MVDPVAAYEVGRPPYSYPRFPVSSAPKDFRHVTAQLIQQPVQPVQSL